LRQPKKKSENTQKEVMEMVNSEQYRKVAAIHLCQPGTIFADIGH